MAKANVWWNKLSRREQIAYLKLHPRSKLKPKKAVPRKKNAGAKPRKRRTLKEAVEGVNDTKPSAPEQDADKVDNQVVSLDTPDLKYDGKETIKIERLSAEQQEAAELYIDNNAKKIVPALSAKVEQEKARIPEVVDSFSPKELNKFGRFVKNAVNNNRGKDLLIASTVFLAKAGLLTVAVGVGASVGINPVVCLAGLWNARDELKQYVGDPIRKFVTEFADGLYEGLQEGVTDLERVKRNVVANPASTSVGESSRLQTESASTATHLSDVIKDFQAIARKNFDTTITVACNNPMQWLKVTSLLDVLYKVEFELRRLRNMHARFRLANESYYVKNCYDVIADLTSKRQQIQRQLAMIATKQRNIETEQFAREVRNHIGRNRGALERTYILDGTNPTLCWVLTASDVRMSTGGIVPLASIYVTCTLPLKVAVSMDQHVTPNSMYLCNTARPKLILSEYGL